MPSHLCRLQQLRIVYNADMLTNLKIDLVENNYGIINQLITSPQKLIYLFIFPEGCNDIVRCYVCDGGLQKWSQGDNAWIEHARWFPHCSYVRVIKGEDFVELVRLSAENEDLEEVDFLLWLVWHQSFLGEVVNERLLDRQKHFEYFYLQVCLRAITLGNLSSKSQANLVISR